MSESAVSIVPPAVLLALAILGEGDGEALAALLGRPLTADDRLALGEQEGVSRQVERFRLAPEVGGRLLAGLEESDPSHYVHWHRVAVNYLAGRLRLGDAEVEPLLMAALRRLTNRLLAEDPGQLLPVVDALAGVPLADQVNRQRISLYRGIALQRIERHEEALVVFDALLEQPELGTVARQHTLNARAVCFRLLGRFETALQDLEASLALARQAGNQEQEGMVLINMGIVSYQLQAYDEAEHQLRQAISLLTEVDSPWLAAAYNELGLVFRDHGRWAEALAAIDEFVNRNRARGAEEQVGLGLLNRGELLLLQGRLSEAESVLHEALSTLKTRLYQVDVHLGLGLVHQVRGGLAEARDAYQQALELALAIERRDILPHVHYRLGEALRRLGDDEGALAQFRAAAGVAETTRAPVRDEQLKISLLGRWQQVYETLVLHCLAMGRSDEAFQWAERARARALADVLSDAPMGEEEAPGVVSAQEVRAALAKDDVLLCYFTAGVLEQDIPLLKMLSSDHPLREHLLTPARILLFLVATEGVEAFECPLDPNLFSTMSPRGSDRLRLLQSNVQQHLARALLGKVDGHLGGRHIYIVPHGPLHLIPFVALLEAFGAEASPGLAYAPSATVLLRRCLASGRAPTGEGSLAVGYNGWRNGRQLRYTEAEVRQVAELLGGEAWTGGEVKKERLRQVAGGYRWLHFACHGWFNPEAPLASYLETGQEERLTAEEVMQEWQLVADLVTLSACQTGVSRVLRGDEPMGLIRALLYAGARAIVASQWVVEDLPTFLLMGRFYELLQEQERKRPGEALLAAQRWLRQLTAEQVRRLVDEEAPGAPLMEGLAAEARPFAEPRFWAAFFLVGKI